jgi:calcineurin-like phosphoesterase family protein
MIYLTGDQHFGHFNVIRYTNRPWTTAYEMDEALISAWNKVVKIDDLVYHLGDFTLSGKNDAERLFSRLNGSIHVLSNPWHHDKKWLSPFNGYRVFSSASRHIVIMELPIVVLEGVDKIEERGVPAILCHYPFEFWDRRHYGSLHFHGHSHGMSPKIPNRLDVGVDSAFTLTGEYRPLSLKEAVEFAKGNTID